MDRVLTYVVDISILAVAAQGNGIAGVLKTEEVQTAHAAFRAGLNTDSNSVLGFLVDDDIMAAAQWERFDKVTGQVILVSEQNGSFGRIDVQELLQRVNDHCRWRDLGETLPLSCQRFEYHDLQVQSQ